ncbi:hypothetical protein BC059799_1144 [Bacillus cereus NVH0597-99]|nr:hypothetical protein BC059799_1144 [Bacillus cereus NVH0597-99]
MENPASKLHTLLSEVYTECARTSDFSGPYAPYKETWANVFGIDPDDRTALLASMNSTFQLFLTTKQSVLSHELLNNERNLKFLSNIENALSSMNFEGSMKKFETHMNSETLTALSFISDHMNFIYKFHESKLDSEEINKLINEIDNLVENITSSNLPEDVKTILFKNLDAIRHSLITYKFSGIEGMKDALGQTIGSMFVNNEVITPVAQDENVRGVFNIIDKMNTILSTGVSIKDLLGPIMGLLLK